MAMVSLEDIALLQKRWNATVTPRSVIVARREGPGEAPFVMVLAREIMRPTPGYFVDHINCDSLDNRRHNLRLCTPLESAWNRRGHKTAKYPKGVRPMGRKFRSNIMCRGVRYHLGTFDTVEEAHAAYCEAAHRLHGEFARVA